MIRPDHEIAGRHRGSVGATAARLFLKAQAVKSSISRFACPPGSRSVSVHGHCWLDYHPAEHPMEPILFSSTNEQSPRWICAPPCSRPGAGPRPLPAPRFFPRLDREELAAFPQILPGRLPCDILRRYTGGVLDDATLRDLCRDAYNFDVPLERVHDRVHVMRLDRGPTASFKDFAARMMARWSGASCARRAAALTILTATSGDTGSAVASAFHGVEGIRVLVLFPRGEVSDRQRKQMTTLRDNIRTIALDGKFDDCQALVKARVCRSGARAPAALLGQLDQHRPAAAADRVLLLRGLAPGPAGRTDRLQRALGQFRQHDGRGHRRRAWACRSSGWSCRSTATTSSRASGHRRLRQDRALAQLPLQRDERRPPQQPRPAGRRLRRAHGRNRHPPPPAGPGRHAARPVFLLRVRRRHPRQTIRQAWDDTSSCSSRTARSAGAASWITWPQRTAGRRAGRGAGNRAPGQVPRGNRTRAGFLAGSAARVIGFGSAARRV